VSMPDWPDTVKDINDAVKLWGKLPTLLTIMQSRETSRIKIELRKKQLVKQLNKKQLVKQLNKKQLVKQLNKKHA
jgi:hypothetical protein